MARDTERTTITGATDTPDIRDTDMAGGQIPADVGTGYGQSGSTAMGSDEMGGPGTTDEG